MIRARTISLPCRRKNSFPDDPYSHSVQTMIHDKQQPLGDLLDAKRHSSLSRERASYVSLAKLAAKTGADVARLAAHRQDPPGKHCAPGRRPRRVRRPMSSRSRAGRDGADASIAFMPARVLMQDFTGVPAVVDLAALRSAVARAGGDPKRVNPFIPVDLIIDHSVQVDRFGSADAYAANLEWEYRRNRERYALAQLGAAGVRGFSRGASGHGNLPSSQPRASWASVCCSRDGWVFPDTLVGTDSHTPMINGLGVLGWGVGGIEAEAAMLGQPMFLPTPIVLGVRTRGTLAVGTTATDLVLTLTQMLRSTRRRRQVRGVFRSRA